MLDKDEQVTTDEKQAVKVIVTEYDDAGHLISETFFFITDTPQNKKEEKNG